MQGNISTTEISATLSYGASAEYIQANYLNLTGGTVNGDLNINGNLTLSDTQYDDMQFPVISSKKGVNDKPDVDYTNLGLLFPQNDQSEYIILGEQFSHSYKLGTNISPHLHYIQDEAQVPIFVLEYRWYDNGKPVPNFQNIETQGAVLPYTGGTMLQMLEFPDIIGSHITGVSSWFEAKLYRKTGDGVTGDVLAKSFDIHYQKDSVGSNEEYQK